MPRQQSARQSADLARRYIEAVGAHDLQTVGSALCSGSFPP